MNGAALYVCPSCGEPVETTVDPSGGQTQEYTEDCPVCCRPNVIRVHFGPEGIPTIDAAPE